MERDNRAAARRRPGSHDPEGNRRAVLDAARRLFGAHGYNGVGIRAIAAEAGVTPGLVMSYFGSKDGLLREVIGEATGDTEDVLTSSGADALPANLARAYLDRWDRLPDDDPWPALIRSAVTHQPSAALLSGILDRQVTAPLMRLLGDAADADARAAVIRSVLFGVIMERYLFAHEPAASVPTGEFATVLTDVLGAAFGEMAEAAPPRGATPGEATRRAAGPDDAAPPPAASAASASAPPAPSALFAGLDRVARRHRRDVEATVRAYGIGPPAFEVLAALREAGDPHRLTMGEIAASGEVRGGLTALVTHLEAEGLVRRDRDSEDRRIVRVRLTRKGAGLTGRVVAARAAQERELLAGLGSADRRRLAALLGELEGTRTGVARSHDDSGPAPHPRE